MLDEQDLHARLLADDPTAPADLADAYLEPLAAWLEVRYPKLHPHDCTTAAEDAIMSLIKNPSSYRPERQQRASLLAYLRMSATAKLSNVQRAERRHSSRRANLEVVELSPTMGKYLWDEEADPARIAERREAVADLQAPVPLPAGLSPQEEQVLQLMDEKERRTAVFARVLGLEHLPQAEQQQEVKRVKDRLHKRRLRAGDHHG